MYKKGFSIPFAVFIVAGTIIPLCLIAFYGFTDRSPIPLAPSAPVPISAPVRPSRTRTTSLGHLVRARHGARTETRIASTTSRSARPARSGSQARAAAGTSGRRTKETVRAEPGGVTQWRPARPRPASWRRAHRAEMWGQAAAARGSRRPSTHIAHHPTHGKLRADGSRDHQKHPLHRGLEHVCDLVRQHLRDRLALFDEIALFLEPFTYPQGFTLR